MWPTGAPGYRAPMDTHPDYNLETAREAGRREELGDWVARFLSSPGSDNGPLAANLTDPPRSWLGPVEVPLDQLNRLAGPPGAPALQPMDDDEWRDDVQELADQVEGGAEPPPVVVSFRDSKLILEDGNHRVEALRRAGVERAWAIIGFDDPDQRDRFVERSGVLDPST